MPSREPLLIHVSNFQGYLFDVDDVERMRDEHRLSGNLGGTLPQLSQQNAFLGVPMLLFPEQVVTLVSNGLAKLVDEPAAHQAPSAQQVHAYESSREAEIESQHARARELAAEKQIQLAKMLNAGDLSRKRAEREEKRQQLASAASEDLATAPPAPSAAPTSSAHAENHVISIESTSSVRLGYNAHGATAATVAEAKQAGFWKYPETKLERSRCKVFEDLWRQGHYLGVGMRFGGDFLVYPGDPLRFHSHFTLTVLASPEQPIMPLDLVAYGRLATAVKKAHLLGAYDEKADKCEYFTLEWAAFG